MKILRVVSSLILAVFATGPALRSGMAQNRAELVEVAHSDQQWTGVAVSQEGRIFVDFSGCVASVRVARWNSRCDYIKKDEYG